mmetsp:Transcript_46840/g.73307  ORF Transcript_46840/g.73307 Transcript_46840/m.73307 type:complete len:383 (-) Transcript_46840:85-1233(-)
MVALRSGSAYAHAELSSIKSPRDAKSHRSDEAKYSNGGAKVPRSKTAKGANIGWLSSVTSWIAPVLICLVYMAAGPCLAMLNPYIMRNADFPYPTIITGFGVLGSTLFGYTCFLMGWDTWMDQILGGHSNSKKTTKQMRGTGIYKFMSPDLIFVGMVSSGRLIASNASLLFITVAFREVMKPLTPVLIMVLLWGFSIERVSGQQVMSLVVMCLGTAITCVSEVQLSIPGILLLVLGSLCEACRCVALQVFLKGYNFTPIETLYYLGPMTCVFHLISVAMFEWEGIWKLGSLLMVYDPFRWFLFAAVTVGGIVVQIVQVLLVRFTGSGLLLKLLNIARNSFTVLGAAFLFGDHLSAIEWVGYGVSVIGFTAHIYFKGIKRDTG